MINIIFVPDNACKTQVVSMVQQSFLHPIVDAAARLGEEVLSARAAQKAFETRPVHKFVFAVTPVNCDVVSAVHGESGHRGLAILPELGQVVSVSGKSTLVCHRETSSLSYLRRSFLRIGRRAAWGKVCKKNARDRGLKRRAHEGYLLVASVNL